MTGRRALLLASCCVLVGAVLNQSWTKASASPRHELLPQPTGWAAFSADAELVHPAGQTYHGRYLRASDGSTRFVLTPDGTDVAHITIRNFAQKAYYVCTGSKWMTGPMEVPPEGYKPPRYHSGMQGLTPYAYKLGLLKGGNRSLRAEKGLDAYHYVTPSGTVWLLAPALNFQAVVKVFLDGMRLEFSEIEIGEPDRSLFLPPPGVAVEHSDIIGGMGRLDPSGLPRANRKK